MTDAQQHAGINPDPNQFTDAKKRLASDPKTNPHTLHKLAQGDANEIAERVAENPHANAEVLEKLSEHDSPDVRSAVSENSNTPNEIIQSLAFDQHPDVRFRLAENPHAPVEVLENLAADENPYVAARAQETLESLKSISEKADEHLVKEEFVEAEQLYKHLANELENTIGWTTFRSRPRPCTNSPPLLKGKVNVTKRSPLSRKHKQSNPHKRINSF